MGLLLLGGAAVALLAFNINPIIADLRPQITLLISNTIGHQVKFGGISARLFPSVAIEVSDLSLSTEGEQGQLAIKQLTLDTSLAGLFNGKVNVNKIAISGGRVTFVREADGKITLAGITPSEVKNENSPGRTSLKTEESEFANASAQTSGISTLKVQINELAIDHLNLTFIDKQAPHIARIVVSDLSGLLLGIDNKQISTVSLRGSVLGETKDNFSFNGGISLTEPSSKRPMINGEVKLAGINVNELTQLLVSYGIDVQKKSVGERLDLGVKLTSTTELIIADLQLTVAGNPNGLEQIAGKILLNGNSLEVKDTEIILSGQKLALAGRLVSTDTPEITGTISGETFDATELLKSYGAINEKLSPATLKGIQCDGSYSISAKSGKLKLIAKQVDTYGTSMSDISIAANLAPDSFNIESGAFSVFGGKVTLLGSFGLGEREKSASAFKLNATNLKMESLSKALTPTSKHPITGTLSQLNADLTSNTQALKESLAGEMSAEILNGSIEGINILGGTLGKVGEVPGLKSTLQGFVPEQYKSALEANSTPFDSLSIETTVQSEKVQLRNVNLQYALYILQGQGWYGFDGDFSIDAQLKLTPLLAQGMVAKQRKLELLLDQNKNIVIPVKISRREGRTIILPDASRLFSTAAKNSAKEAAAKALDKIAPGLGGAAGVLDQLFK